MAENETPYYCPLCGCQAALPKEITDRLTAQAQEIEQLRTVIDKLPKTRDGVLIQLNMTVYWRSGHEDSLKKGRLVSSLEIYDGGWNAFRREADGNEYILPGNWALYSTEAAARAAKENLNGGDTR